MEPILNTLITAAIGGAAGKFVEKALDSGSKWLLTHYKDHGDAAQKQAIANTTDFLNKLAQKVKQLEESQQISNKELESAQDHPDFSMMLQKAMLTSAQTESKEKHIILARLVSERLKSGPESILALASKMACDTISYTTINQLMILGLAVNLHAIRPIPNPPEGVDESGYQRYMDFWLKSRLSPYNAITVLDLDIIHLGSLSCLKYNTLVERDLNAIFKVDNFVYHFEKAADIEFSELIQKKWKILQKIELTTVGQILGVYVSDLLTETNTTFPGWH